MWSSFQQLWELRNSYDHNTDAAQQLNYKRQQLLQELQEVHDERINIHTIDANIFYNSLKEHLHNHHSPSQV